MKRKKIRLIIILVIVAALLFPIRNIYKDGGTTTYTSLTYKIIRWNKMIHVDEMKTGTEIHLFPNNFHDIEYYN
ncbi:hypothetical protein HNQ56_000245 [Anaerotaenia torta]|uniref:hypothetical protein n=1 Tax=Anaerotaenia torta TaxID=433293 RepID=UPI003D1A50F0